MTETQNSMLLEHLKSGKTITMAEAFIDFGIARLSGRIYDLKKKGVIIDDEWITVKKANGDDALVKEYKYIGEIT